jgi:N-acetylglutamate synthase-like GNAT family acetyltransferase
MVDITEYDIRPFEMTDQEEIKHLYRATVAANPDRYYRPLSGPQLPDNIAENFSPLHDAFIVATSQGKIIGFCGLRTLPEDRTIASFVNGTVIPELQGKGVYKALYQARESEALRRGIKTFLAITSHKNTKMKDFLIRQGFEVYEPEQTILGFWHLRKRG